MELATSPTAPSVDFRQRECSSVARLRLRQLAFGRRSLERSVSPWSDRPDQVFGLVVEESGASRLRELETEAQAPVDGGLRAAGRFQAASRAEKNEIEPIGRPNGSRPDRAA